MYKFRLSFSKTGYAKFVSHLDLMKTFQRVFRIAGLEFAFSQGFNPHPIMSIGNPVPTGVEGMEEYMDFSLKEDSVSTEEIKDRLNNVLPPDFKILNVWEPVEPLNLITKAEYNVSISVKNRLDNFEEYIEALKVKDDIVVAKKTKRSISNVDIKPWIYRLDLIDGDGINFKFNMVLAVGGNFNLKVNSVFDAFTKYVPNFEINEFRIIRQALYKENMLKIDC